MRNFENVDLSVLSKELRKIFRLKIFFFFFFRDGGREGIRILFGLKKR